MENKVLCECHNVTQNDVVECIKDGVTEFKVLQERTKISTDCPSCKENNEALFNELVKNYKK